MKRILVWMLVGMVVSLLLSLYMVGCGPKPPTSAKPTLPEQHLYLTIDENGEMELNQNPLTFSNLKEVMVKERARLNETSSIVIQVPDTSHPDEERAFRDQTIRVMNIAKEIGVIDLTVVRPSKGK